MSKYQEKKPPRKIVISFRMDTTPMFGITSNGSCKDWGKYHVNTKQDYRKEKHVQNTSNIICFSKQENQVEQDHNEYMDKNIIWALNKIDT